MTLSRAVSHTAWFRVLVLLLLSGVSPLAAADPPLCRAVFSEDTKAVKAALETLRPRAKVDTPMCDANRTPLAYASSRGYRDGVAEIIEFGASVDAPSGGPKLSKGTTPLMLAAANNRLEVVKLLIEKGADMNAVDVKGRTALWFATENERTPIVQYLKERRALLSPVKEGAEKHP